MKPLGKTIQIYCPSGDPRGVRIAEITTRIVQAVVVPRAKLDEAMGRAELGGVGLYVLFGESERGGLPMAYIGEAEDCGVRFRQHNAQKDFWNVGVAIVSRTGSFTKAHGKLLEWLAIGKALQTGRYQLDNGNRGGEPSVPEWMQSDVAEIFETAEVLLSTLGFPLMEPLADRAGTDKQIFFCTRGGANARGVYNEEGFVVFKGSFARRDVVDSAKQSTGPKRQSLIDSGVLIPCTEGYQFERDTLFSTPSAAAEIVVGGASNGWLEWKDASGRTLDDVYRKSAVE